MTALLEYLDLLHYACLGSKAAACKTIFNLPYASYCPMHLTRKVYAYVSLDPGLSGPSRTIARWLPDTLKTNFGMLLS